MKMKDLHNKNVDELKAELFNLLREQFNLRIQATGGESQKPHLFKQVRRNIARVKTLLTQKVKA